ncbi:hypothetical protein [Novosphingobium sp. PP1Y]|uniref:hypothetical protein n=1 Tax=Novosphingobium sp. PP1Y TaxID=702113 RepID=UPI00020EEDCB|nr:hypothetical protein [Novosphingobium sp. PP1Y]CCA93129.1 hypothetical protein PP1Y_AT23052 [Novosphingobium sp. PP1Y]
MDLFRVEAEEEKQGEQKSTGTWLIAAGSLFGAMSLVPESYAVKSVNVQLDTAWGLNGLSGGCRAGPS